MKTTFEVSQLGFGKENIFQLEEPNSYFCRVWSYKHGHSILTIYLRKEEPSGKDDDLYLMFEDVTYFDGPFWWPNANFSTARFEQYVDLLNKVEVDEKKIELDSQIIENKVGAIPSRLFIIETLNTQVKIVASFALLGDGIPKDVN